jgi:signal transduction histidine kinase
MADTPPSIRSRLASALGWWMVASALAVGTAVWLAASNEVDELLDDTLQASAELLASLNLPSAAPDPRPAAADAETQFAWQVVAADGTLRTRSAGAPAIPWHAGPAPGFSDVDGWHVYGMAFAETGQMLYTAQPSEERQEARVEVALGVVAAAIAVGLVGQVWLRRRVRNELIPLQSLSDRLARLDADVLDPAVDLGAPERAELAPVHAAVQALRQRLLRRVANERAIAAHAAHALRTPLAGIDAQLAVALRALPADALGGPGDTRERLLRVRQATTRLQAVVAALLGLFRSGGTLHREGADVARLVGLLPVHGLSVEVAAGTTVQADVDLLSAALLNLLDNAVRHGGHHVRIDLAAPQRLRLADDGPGVDAPRRQRLVEALHSQSDQGPTGLGLLMADQVARAHGGQLLLPDAPHGFVVVLDLGPA